VLAGFTLFDVVALVVVFAFFVLGFAQGTIRRLLGLAVTVLAIVVALLLRDPVGDWLSRYWMQFPPEYVTMLAFAGDGGAADVGFQSLSGAAERGEQMIFICLDNEGYMNTGVQRSGTTPYGAWTSTTPVGSVLRGKTRDAKPMPLIMVVHHCEYVATASLAFMEDYYAKLDQAVRFSKKGMAYIHVFSPCPTGWRFSPSMLIEVSRKAVQTNMVPLWEYVNHEGRLRFTYPVDSPLPVKDYLSLVGKYRHLSEEQIAHIQETVNNQMKILRSFTGEGPEMTAARVTARLSEPREVGERPQA
jgi:pyruvate/2-oxoacid:ferredoxin oxidoreductase beta subunit